MLTMIKKEMEREKAFENMELVLPETVACLKEVFEAGGAKVNVARRGEESFALDINKCYFFKEKCYGIGQMVWTTITSLTGLMLAGKCVVVAGYDAKGKDIAGTARAFGMRVTVTEDNPVRAVEAVMEGFDVVMMDEAAKYCDIFVTATDTVKVISEQAFMVMKDGAVLCNAGSYGAIDTAYLEDTYIEKENAEDGVTSYELMNGRSIRVINDGRSLADETDELDKAVYVLATKMLATGCEGDAIEEAKEEVARRMLRTLGVRI